MDLLFVNFVIGLIQILEDDISAQLRDLSKGRIIKLTS